MHKFKYLGCMVNDRDMEKDECEKIINGRKVAEAIKTLVKKRGLSIVCVRFT